MLLTHAASILLAASISAAPTSGPDEPIVVSARADVARPAPGERFHLLVTMHIEPEWHVYWRNPGSNGGPTEFTVTAPPGFLVEAPRFPVPKSFAEEFGPTYGYEREVTFFLPVMAPTELTDDAVTFRVHVDYLACRSICRLGDADVTVTLPGPDPDRLQLEAARARLPKRVRDVDGTTCRVTEEAIEIFGPALGTDAIVLYPDPSPGVDLGDPVMLRAARGFRIRIPYRFESRNALGRRPVAAGVIAFGTKPDAPALEFEVSLDASAQPKESNP